MKALCLAFCVLTTLLLAAVCVSPARADWCHGGEVPSLEWLVDASNIITGKIVEETGTGRYAIRVKKVVKRSQEFSAKAGDVVDCTAHRGWHSPRWEEGDPVLVFFGNDTKPVHRVVNLVRPEVVSNRAKDPYLMVDMHGKIVLDRDELMRCVRARVETTDAKDGGFRPVCEDGFEYYPKVCDIDGDSEYYSLRVPPDPCFRKMLEEAAGRYKHTTFPGHAVWAQSALFKYYSDITDGQLEEHRKKLVRSACDFAKIIHTRRDGRFSCVNYYTFPDPHRWFGTVSPDGRFLALLAGDRIELHDLVERDSPHTCKGHYVHHRRNAGLVFAPDSKHFAHLQANGDVTLFDLKRKKVKQTFKFSWEPESDMFVLAFSFSPDGRYLALNMHSGDAVRGCALQVWDVESDKSVLKPADDWGTEFSIEGFSRDSKLLKAGARSFSRREPEFVDRVWNLETGEVTDEPSAVEWLLPNAPHNSHLPLGRLSAESPPRAESPDGKLRAEFVPGKPQRLVIRDSKSNRTVRSMEFTGMDSVRDMFFSSRGDAVFLVTGRCIAWMFKINDDPPRPTKFSCMDTQW